MFIQFNQNRIFSSAECMGSLCLTDLTYGNQYRKFSSAIFTKRAGTVLCCTVMYRTLL